MGAIVPFMVTWRTAAMRRAAAAAAAVGLALALVAGAGAGAGAGAARPPRYDVPDGFTRCPEAIAWNGFFKWASARHATCRRVEGFMRAYARRAEGGRMPRHALGLRCRIRYWRNGAGDIYASRHTCVRADVVIRFYGMV